MAIGRPLHIIRRDIQRWMVTSKQKFDWQFIHHDGKIWVLKYFSPRYLDAYFDPMNLARHLLISNTPGYTWGDAVYVTPLRNAYSTMMYGRIGVMGWIHQSDATSVYDATEPDGILLFQEWMMHQTYLFDKLTTTIHSELANQEIRNKFRQEFNIDILYFPPDQHNTSYVDDTQDSWFAISDPGMPGNRLQSTRVRDCEWVLLVLEEFEMSHTREHFNDLIGHRLGAPINVSNRPDISTAIYQKYQDIHTTVGSRHHPYILHVSLI